MLNPVAALTVKTICMNPHGFFFIKIILADPFGRHYFPNSLAPGL